MKRVFSLLITATINLCVVAQNPIIGDVGGISDPHIRLFNDKIYLFSGHDDTPEDRIWTMKDWRVFSTSDLCNWSLVQTISPKDNFMGEGSEDCWASDAGYRDGKYYFYFSDQKRGIGVLRSDNPEGIYHDVLGKYLISPHHDPTIFIDDDEAETPYILYGDKAASYRIVKLNNDMISLAEEPRHIEIEGQIWDEEPVWVDKSYLFKYNDTYYLSWGQNYATSKEIYGPYNCVGAVGDGHNLSNLAHGSFFNWKGQFYHIWCYYIRKGYRYRESIISYCHMDDNGEIVTDIEFLDQHFSNGVGQYSASWDKIEAEWYYEISDGIKKRGLKGQGFHLSQIEDGDFIRFANVSFDELFTTFNACVKQSSSKGKLEVRVGSQSGKVIAVMKLNESSKFTTQSCKLKSLNGKHDIYLTYRGDKKSVMELDWISFTN